LVHVAEGKWLDPVLGALAWHGYSALPDKDAYIVWHTRTVACNMLAFFPGFADSIAIFLATPAPHPSVDDPLAILPSEIRDEIHEAALAPEASDGPEELARRLDNAGWNDFVGKARSRLFPPYAGPPGTTLQAAQAVLQRQPVLGPSVDLFAKLAQSAGRTTHWALERRRQLNPRAIWNFVQRSD
jgi:hypothetical protein